MAVPVEETEPDKSSSSEYDDEDEPDQNITDGDKFSDESIDKSSEGGKLDSGEDTEHKEQVRALNVKKT